MEPEVIAELILGTSGLAGVMRALYYIYGKLKNILTPKSKAALAHIIIYGTFTDLCREISISLSGVLDYIFTTNQWSLKCFRKSMYISFLLVLFFHVWYFYFHAAQLTNLGLFGSMYFIQNAFIFFILYNAVDFFLLWKTRKLLKYLSDEKCQYPILVLTVDMVGTFLFATVKFIVIMALLTGNARVNFDYFFHTVIQFQTDTAYNPRDTTRPFIIPGVFFYATFFYSMFLWTYYVLLTVMKKLMVIDWVMGWFRKRFEIKKNPFDFIKVVFVTMAVMVFFLMLYLSFTNWEGLFETLSKKAEMKNSPSLSWRRLFFAILV